MSALNTWYIRQQAKTARIEAEVWKRRSQSLWSRLWLFDFSGAFAKKAEEDWLLIANDWDNIADEIEQAEKRRVADNV